MDSYIDSFGLCDYGVAFVFDYATPSDIDNGDFCSTGITRKFKNTVEGLKDPFGGFYDLSTGFYVSSVVRSDVCDKSGKVIEQDFTRYKKEHGSILISELKNINAKVIVTIGSRAFKFFTGLALTRSIGKFTKPSMSLGFADDVWIFPQESIFTLLQNNFSGLCSKLDFIIKVAIGDIVNPEDEFVLTPYKVISSIDEFQELVSMVISAGVFCHDYETNGLEWYDSNFRVTLLSISFNPGFAYCIPLEHNESPFTSDDIDFIFKQLDFYIFKNPNVEKIAHNLKYEMHINLLHGITGYVGIFHDTMLMSHLLDENTPNGLKDLQHRYFPDYDGYAIVTNFWENIPLKQLTKYGAADADITLRLKLYFERLLLFDDEHNRLYLVYRNLTMFVFKTLFYMEHRGAKINRKFIDECIIRADSILYERLLKLYSYTEVKEFEAYERNRLLAEELGNIDDKINEHMLSGFNRTNLINKLEMKRDAYVNGEIELYEHINFNSVPQLRGLLFGKHGFRFKPGRDENGDIVEETSQDFLSTIDHPFINDLLAYRSISKMVSTYYKGISDKLDFENNVHTSFNLHGTVTGRLSSRNPNLQNIPWFTKLQDDDVRWAISNVKKFFIPRDGMCMLQADFSQAELRLIANFSGDENMQRAYSEGKDVHSITACNIYGYEYSDFKKLAESDPVKYKDMRAVAKSANFGLVYDISDLGYIEYIRANTGRIISEDEAHRHRDALFVAFPKIPYWHALYKAKAEKFGFVRTLFGRKRRLPDAISGRGAFKSKALRNSINAPIQGTGGEWTLFSLALIDLLSCGLFCPTNTVHDSIIGDFYFKDLDYVKNLISFCCSDAPVKNYFVLDDSKLVVKMVVDIDITNVSWGDMGKIV